MHGAPARCAVSPAPDPPLRRDARPRLQRETLHAGRTPRGRDAGRRIPASRLQAPVVANNSKSCALLLYVSETLVTGAIAMTSLDRTFKLLVELGDPAARQTRTELVDRALQTALAIVDA